MCFLLMQLVFQLLLQYTYSLYKVIYSPLNLPLQHYTCDLLSLKSHLFLRSR